MKSFILSKKNGYILRLAQNEDVSRYYEQNYCPLDYEVARLTGSKQVFTKEEVTSFFLKSVNDKDMYFFLIISPDGRIIGESVINEIDRKVRCANFRIAIYHTADRGHGLGAWVTEKIRDFAFSELNLHRLELEVYSFNTRAENMYLKAGFKREGIKRDAIFNGDEYADIIFMSILENEWKVLKRLQS